LGDKTKKIGLGGAFSTYGVRRGAYRILVWKLEGKRSLGRLGHSWEINIKVDLQ